MLRAYHCSCHVTDYGWELEADDGNHERKFGSGDCWEPEVHALGQCVDKGKAGCIGSLFVA